MIQTKPVISTFAGQIEVCQVWDFLSQVKKNYAPEYSSQVHEIVTAEHKSRPFNLIDRPVARVAHALIQNPAKLLTSLKKHTTKVYFKRRLSLQELLDEVGSRSYENFGKPTHCFPVGEDLYAVVCESDLVLAVTSRLRQQLICTAPKRNFVVYAPNLRFN